MSEESHMSEVIEATKRGDFTGQTVDKVLIKMLEAFKKDAEKVLNQTQSENIYPQKHSYF